MKSGNLSVTSPPSAGSAARSRPSRAICAVFSRTFFKVISEDSICKHKDQTSARDVSESSEVLGVAAERIRRLDRRKDESVDRRLAMRGCKSPLDKLNYLFSIVANSRRRSHLKSAFHISMKPASPFMISLFQ